MENFLTALIAAGSFMWLYSPSKVEAAEKTPVEVTNARWYPLYHIAAPSGWINDPNGFCVYNGKYHFFYQHYPYSTQWGPMHWGHVVSDDLVHWEHLPIALEPDKDYEGVGGIGGCFSGSAIEKDGKLYLMYTGHATLPEKTPEGIDASETQNIAMSADGINFEKYEGNPVLFAPTEGDIHSGDFRDPKVWKHDDKYFVVLGSKNKAGDRGQILLFESENLIDWTFKNIMSTSQGNEGTMWECPNFVEIDRKEVIIMSPIGIQPEGNKFLNMSQAGYIIGKLDYNTGVFTHEPFEMLDYGFDFYAPQITKTPEGRVIMIGWADMWGSEFAENVDGWSGMMTLPRELHVKSGKIISKPVKELEKLRVSEKSYKSVKVKERMSIYGIEGETGELVTTIDVTRADGFLIELRSSEEEKTVLSYDKESGIFKLNRNQSGVGLNGEREVKIDGKKVDLQIFIDRSSIEVFINDGEYVMTSRIYPKAESQGIFFEPINGTLNLKKVSFYKLDEGIPQPVIK